MGKKPRSKNKRTLAELRSLAEERLKQAPLCTADCRLPTHSDSPGEMRRLVHELEVYQVELEMQQEELARTRIELEGRLMLYTDLYDFAPTGYLTLGRDSKIHQANLTATKLLGVDRSRLLGMRFKKLVIPEDHRVLDALLEKVFTKRVPGKCEVKLLADTAQPSQTPQTHVGHIVHLNAAISDTDYGCRVILSEITDQKNAENELHRLARILRATTLCNQALIHSTDEMELVQKICNIVVDIGGYRMAWIGYAEHDKEKRVRPIAQSGFEEGYLETVTISWDDTAFGRGPTGTAIRTGKPITSFDIIHDPMMKPWRKDAIKHGFASSLSLPLKAGSEIFGALTMYSSHPGAFNAEEAKLHTTLADNLAYGITMLRTSEAKQRAEDELKHSEERFRRFFQSHSSVMLIVDLDTGSIIDANPAAEDFYGWSIEELCRMHIHDINTVSSEEVDKNLEKVRFGGRRRYLFQHRRADASLRDVEAFANVIEVGGKDLVYAIIHDITEQKVAEQKILGYVKRLQNAMQSTLDAIAKVVEAHDPYTAGHERRVGIIAADIAREMGWSEEKCHSLQLIGLVHDIGKMSIPAEILSKPGRLSTIEFELVKTHAEQGYQIFQDVEFPLPIAEIIREHHERMDGSGYPQGLKGEETLLEARILAVADVLEAMASHRPYRSSLGLEEAINEIESHRVQHFDPLVVDAMLRLFREKGYQLPD
jgi:PAS domain S-box-containing protein/putative nucleotidyltransferase with HDIG domain